MTLIPAILCWSGGKDCSMALHYIQVQRQYEVRYLLTTLHAHTHRVGMHGTRPEVIERQAAAIGLPLQQVWVDGADNASYETAMLAAFWEAAAAGIQVVVFGDIFLADLRHYREQMLKPTGLQAVFPLWQADTSTLMKEFASLGFRAKICCLNSSLLHPAFAGAELDNNLLANLPRNTDPCGENGEYHTICYAGPIFHEPVRLRKGANHITTMAISADAAAQIEFTFTDWLPKLT